MNQDDERELFQQLARINRRLSKFFGLALAAIGGWAFEFAEHALQEHWSLGEPWNWIVALAVIGPICIYVGHDFDH
jgi:hypothetical protein